MQQLQWQTSQRRRDDYIADEDDGVADQEEDDAEEEEEGERPSAGQDRKDSGRKEAPVSRTKSINNGAAQSNLVWQSVGNVSGQAVSFKGTLRQHKVHNQQSRVSQDTSRVLTWLQLPAVLRKCDTISLSCR